LDNYIKVGESYSLKFLGNYVDSTVKEKQEIKIEFIRISDINLKSVLFSI
jgi:hypothetical protein